MIANKGRKVKYLNVVQYRKYKPTYLFAKIENMDGKIITLGGSNPPVGMQAIFKIHI